MKTPNNKINNIFALVSVVVMLIILTGCSGTNGVYKSRSISWGKTDRIKVKDKNTIEIDSKSDKPAVIPSNYVLCESDVLNIQYLFKKDYNQKVTVGPDGKISLPFVGSIPVTGKNVETLHREISHRYRILAGDEGPNGNPIIKEYRIGAGDVLEIKFAQNREYNEKITVRPDGKISLVMVGTVIAEHKTPEALTTELRWRYARFIKSPNPVVILRKFSSNRYYVNGKLVRPVLKDLDKLAISLDKFSPVQIYVGGEVARPGVYSYRKGMSAMQAVIQSGGNKLSGDMKQIVIIRRGADQRGKIMIRNIKSDKVKGQGSNSSILAAVLNDLKLQPFDVIIVPKTTIASVNDFLNQYIFQTIPPLRNSSFNFIYDVDGNRFKP